MQRRNFLKLGASAGAAWATKGIAEALPPPAIPIIDSHIHLFDTARPGGVPWPEKGDPIYKPALPDRYTSISAPFGIVGAIAIEASPLPSDNDWLLKVASEHPIMVGVIGDLVPGSSTYRADLNRLHANPLFLGIRYGNLWARGPAPNNPATDNLAIDKQKPEFLDGLKDLMHHGLVFESANPNADLIRAIVGVADKFPDLRIVVDHLPHAPIPTGQSDRDAYTANLRHLADNPNVYIKLSEIPALVDKKLQLDPAFYRDHLDAIWDIFGEDHILFGSDWPNSDHVAPYSDTLAIVHAYISKKGTAAQEKYFWKNSIAAYKWHRRTSNQPIL